VRQLEFVKPAAIELDGIFLTDHNRSELNINNQRLVNDIRTQFGELRRYYKADKKSFTVNWSMIPQSFEYTVDANLGAEDMKDLFESKQGLVNLKIYFDFGDEQDYRVVITDFSFILRNRWDEYRFYDCSLAMEEI
jgi:hypothetical protein